MRTALILVSAMFYNLPIFNLSIERLGWYNLKYIFLYTVYFFAHNDYKLNERTLM